MLDLFSGTGSVHKVCEQRAGEIEVCNLDISDKYHAPTVETDIMQ